MCLKGVTGFFIGIMVACGICLLGAFFVFGASGSERKKADEIAGLPGKTFAEFSELQVGEEAAITGQLNGNSILTTIDGSRESSTADYKLVIAQAHQWNVTETTSSNNNSKSTRGTWNSAGREAPDLNMNFQDKQVTIFNAQVNQVIYGGNMQTFYEKTSSGLSAKSGTETYYQGTVRIQGYQDNTLITVVGVKSGDAGIVPERFFGGRRQQLIDDIETGAKALVLAGFGMMACSVFVVFASIMGLISRAKQGLNVVGIARRQLRI